jgi:CRISPR-associated protein Csd2
MNTSLKNRYDFIYVFDVQDGNPNGDPDAGNLPRVDPETGKGLVTDVCLKRKVRNFIDITQRDENGRPKPGYDIYVREKAVLARAHFGAFQKLNILTGQESRKSVPANLVDAVTDCALPEGVTFDDGGEDNNPVIVIAADADKKTITAWFKDEKPPKEIISLIREALKDARPRKPTAEETERGRKQMCEDYYDIRTFGAVMSLKSAPNCGQVRGPVQMTFARSVEPVVTLEHSITRMAVATEAEAEKQSGDNRTMGRKNTVPYGIYVAHGFISPHLANQTGFGEADLALLWDALKNMFEHDRSAARGLMAARGLDGADDKPIVFKHESALGNAPAHQLFDLVTIKRKDDSKPARSRSDYEIVIDRSRLPKGVLLEEKI